MTPIQQLMLGVGAKDKVYMDDVFSTHLWIGNGSNSATQTMTTGIDLVNNEGMVWVSNRDTANNDPKIIDTVRGQTGSAPSAPYYLLPQSSNDQSDRNWQWTDLTNGFSFNQDYGDINGNGEDMCAWTFRKSSMFTIATWTGNASAPRSISHDLGSVPGLIIIKCTSSDNTDWTVWHRDFDAKEYIRINNEAAKYANEAKFGGQLSGSARPTATTFALGTSNDVNGSGNSYIAYIFAGGTSAAATARSVDFESSSSHWIYSDSTSSDFTMGTGDFTVECWGRLESPVEGGLFQISSGSTGFDNTKAGTIAIAANCHNTNDHEGRWDIYSGSGDTTKVTGINLGVWYHLAYVRSSGVSKLYVNGTEQISITDTTNYTGNRIAIGRAAGNFFDGEISNLRVVKGTAVYTSSFRPPTEPLTNITNTKLLCLNNSSITGTSVSPSTLTTSGGGTIAASIDSPFDDPAGFKFGEGGDQNVVKCGTYIGNGNSKGPEIFLGWEPQWIMVKIIEGDTGSWSVVDSMRGINSAGGNDAILNPGASTADDVFEALELTSTGFRIKTTGGFWNGNDKTYMYIAIRRSDGYVGKPIEDATKCFAMDTGSESSSIPNYDSGFAVDFAFYKSVGGTYDWYTSARQMSGKYLFLNTTGTQTNASNLTFDSNVGWSEDGHDSGVQSWMWKRHAGFDTVLFEGTNINNLQVPHGLNAVPEMIWIKNRDASENWGVYHKGLNNGTNPEQYVIRLNSDNPEFDHNEWWNDTAPTSTHFTVGIQGETNGSEKSMLAVLFSSVSGVSKVGHYSGTGSSNHSITTGFQPRFILIKPAHRADGYGGGWSMFDTTRGINSGSERPLRLNYDSAESSQNLLDYIDLDSDGFTIQSTALSFNGSNARYIYYAHA